MNRKAATTPHSIIIAVLLFTLCISLGLAFFTDIFTGMGENVPDIINETGGGLSLVNESAAELVNDLEGNINQTSWISTACRNFAGDNFFCGALDSVSNLVEAPGTYRAVIEYSNEQAALPFTIPKEFAATIIAIITTIILWVIIYNVRRYHNQ